MDRQPQAHSPEPWSMTTLKTTLLDRDGKRVVSLSDYPTDQEDSDLRRIKACVNLLADVPTEVLEDITGKGFTGPQRMILIANEIYIAALATAEKRGKL